MRFPSITIGLFFCVLPWFPTFAASERSSPSGLPSDNSHELTSLEARVLTAIYDERETSEVVVTGEEIFQFLSSPFMARTSGSERIDLVRHLLYYWHFVRFAVTPLFSNLEELIPSIDQNDEEAKLSLRALIAFVQIIAYQNEMLPRYFNAGWYEIGRHRLPQYLRTVAERLPLHDPWRNIFELFAIYYEGTLPLDAEKSAHSVQITALQNALRSFEALAGIFLNDENPRPEAKVYRHFLVVSLGNYILTTFADDSFQAHYNRSALAGTIAAHQDHVAGWLELLRQGDSELGLSIETGYFRRIAAIRDEALFRFGDLDHEHRDECARLMQDTNLVLLTLAPRLAGHNAPYVAEYGHPVPLRELVLRQCSETYEVARRIPDGTLETALVTVPGLPQTMWQALIAEENADAARVIFHAREIIQGPAAPHSGWERVSQELSQIRLRGGPLARLAYLWNLLITVRNRPELARSLYETIHQLQLEQGPRLESPGSDADESDTEEIGRPYPSPYDVESMNSSARVMALVRLIILVDHWDELIELHTHGEGIVRILEQTDFQAIDPFLGEMARYYAGVFTGRVLVRQHGDQHDSIEMLRQLLAVFVQSPYRVIREHARRELADLNFNLPADLDDRVLPAEDMPNPLSLSISLLGFFITQAYWWGEK